MRGGIVKGAISGVGSILKLQFYRRNRMKRRLCAGGLWNLRCPFSLFSLLSVSDRYKQKQNSKSSTSGTLIR